MTKAERVLRCLASNDRRAVLYTMLEGEWSPVQISRELGMPLRRVAYHVKTLHAARLVRPTRTRLSRGAVEHPYRATDLARRVLAGVEIVVKAVDTGNAPPSGSHAEPKVPRELKMSSHERVLRPKA